MDFSILRNKTIQLNKIDVGYYKSGENVEEKCIVYLGNNIFNKIKKSVIYI